MTDFATMYPELFRMALMAGSQMGQNPSMSTNPTMAYSGGTPPMSPSMTPMMTQTGQPMLGSGNRLGGVPPNMPGLSAPFSPNGITPQQTLYPDTLTPQQQQMLDLGMLNKVGSGSGAPAQTQTQTQQGLTPEQALLLQKMMPGNSGESRTLSAPGTFGRPQLQQMQPLQLPQAGQPLRRQTLAQLLYGK